ncbi:hypothetical protein [Mycobacterium sp.]|uniref:hypothetical protein n=1 Tax=Mycobacterium sp. TaxID=1785 RepID=UPI003BB50CD2
MTTFAPHRDTLESFIDCIHGGVDENTLTRLLAENVVLYGPFGDEPVTGREAAVKTIKTVNKLSSDDTYTEVLSGGTHHAAHFRLQVGDAAVNGIFFALLDADGKIAEVSIFYRTLRPVLRCSATSPTQSACRPGNYARTRSNDHDRAGAQRAGTWSRS